MRAPYNNIRTRKLGTEPALYGLWRIAVRGSCRANSAGMGMLRGRALVALALTAGGAHAFDTALSGGPPAGLDALGAGKLQLQAPLTTYDPNVRLGAARCAEQRGNTPSRRARS